MKVVFSHDTALRIIRRFRLSGKGRPDAAGIRTLADCVATRTAVEAAAPAWLRDVAAPLDVLVGSQAKSCRSRGHRCHVATTPLPSGSFFRLGESSFASLPELAFVQMAYRLSLLDAVKLGMELCGEFVRPMDWDVVRAGQSGQRLMRFRRGGAITTRARLESYATRCRAVGVRGATAALNALRWVADGALSPAEASLALFLSLPVRLGGYGLPMPTLNPTTSLGVRGGRMLGQDSMRCDLHWLDRRVAVEYNSSQEHLSPRAAGQDARRVNALGHENVRLIVVTPRMVLAPDVFDQTMRQLAAALGYRLRPSALGMSPARAALRVELFPWLVVG